MTTKTVAPMSAPAKAPFVLDKRGAGAVIASYHAARAAEIATSGPLALFAALTLRALSNDCAWTETSTAALAKQLDADERKVTRWLAELRDAGWIERRSRTLSSGKREIARTTIVGLKSTQTQPATVTSMTKLEGEGRQPDHAAATEVLEHLSTRVEIQRVADPAMRKRIAAEVVWSVLACALSRIPRAKAINIALKKLRERAWRTPRSMPLEYPTTLWAQASAPTTAVASQAQRTATLEPMPVTPADAPRTVTPGVAARFLRDIGAQLSHPTQMSGNSLLVETSQRAGCSPPQTSGGDPTPRVAS